MSSAAKSASNSAERRRSTRKPHVVEAWIVSPTSRSDADRVAVQSVNVSRHGVAFSSQTPVAVGAFHRIDIRIDERTTQREILISYCRPVGSRFDVGGEFR